MQILRLDIEWTGKRKRSCCTWTTYKSQLYGTRVKQAFPGFQRSFISLMRETSQTVLLLVLRIGAVHASIHSHVFMFSLRPLILMSPPTTVDEFLNAEVIFLALRRVSNGGKKLSWSESQMSFTLQFPFGVQNSAVEFRNSYPEWKVISHCIWLIRSSRIHGTNLVTSSSEWFWFGLLPSSMLRGSVFMAHQDLEKDLTKVISQ
jgi:hypothetical protein